MIAYSGPADTGQAARLLADIASTLARKGATAENVCPEYINEVPPELVDKLASAVALPDRTVGARVVTGLLDGLAEPGPTPPDWSYPRSERARAFDIAMMLVGSVIGQVFGWLGQQDGRFVHDIVPSRGSENIQVGASSTTPLAWHTEDSFHPNRAVLLLLGCIRNRDSIGSRVASIREAELSDEHIIQLRRKVMMITPDSSYPKFSWESADRALGGHGISTLWDAEDGLCIRYDPPYSQLLSDADAEFLSAYDALGRELDRCGQTVSINAGDILLLDNYIAVHGRASFIPRYDGTDRWLKRILIRRPRCPPPDDVRKKGYGQQAIESPLSLDHFGYIG